MSTNHILIIALSNHPVLGPLLIPYFAKAVSQDVISVEEQATHAGNDTELSEMEKRVIAIAQSYSEKNLMQVYSRQQTVAGFLSSVTAEMLKKQLRLLLQNLPASLHLRSLLPQHLSYPQTMTASSELHRPVFYPIIR